jgi:protein SSD1
MTDDTNKSKDKRSRGGKSGGGSARPSSAASNSTVGGNVTKNTQSNSPDSGSEQKRGESVSRQGSTRGRGQGGGRGGHRKASSTSQNGSRTSGGNATQKAPQTASVPVPAQSDGSDALQSLQRVITDLKSISPPVNAVPLSGNNPLGSSLTNTTLPANVPFFQPGATTLSAVEGRSSPKHRKAASMGSNPTSLSANYASPLQQFQSNLGSMAEDSERGGLYEEGEIPEPMSWQQQQDFPGVAQKANASGFVAPRFAALAQQQQQQQQATREVLGPSGRPQLAPGFTFGTRRKPSSNAMSLGPPIDEEEDANFQFPQSMPSYPQDPSPASTGSRRPESTDIGGIMAEQVLSPMSMNAALY